MILATQQGLDAAQPEVLTGFFFYILYISIICTSPSCVYFSCVFYSVQQTSPTARSGNRFNRGSHIVTYMATNANGLHSTCMFSLEVKGLKNFLLSSIRFEKPSLLSSIQLPQAFIKMFRTHLFLLQKYCGNCLCGSLF